MDANSEEFEAIRPSMLPNYIEKIIDYHFSLMNWSDDDMMLDIGCGFGKIAKYSLLPRCPKINKIIAIDIAPNFIHYAQNKYSDEKIEFKVQNIMDRIAVEDEGRFNKIFSSFALNYTSDYDTLFSNISKLLKPGGYFSFIIAGKTSLYSIIREIATHKDWMAYIKTKDILATIPPTEDWDDVENEFKQFISKFGLNAIQTNFEVLNIPFTSKEDFMKYMKILSPRELYENMPEEIKEKLWKEKENDFLKYTVIDEDSNIIWPLQALTAYGRKQ